MLLTYCETKSSAEANSELIVTREPRALSESEIALAFRCGLARVFRFLLARAAAAFGGRTL